MRHRRRVSSPRVSARDFRDASPPPDASILDRVLSAALFVLTVAVWAPRWRFGLESPAPYDEGNTVVAAWRLLAGEALYRDVWQIQGPGTAYLLAAVFRLFGMTLTVERVLKTLFLAATVAVLYRVHRRFAVPAAAAASSLLFAVLTSHTAFLRPATPGLLFVLLAVLLGLRSLERPPGRGHALGAGLAVGTAALFRHDFGAYAVLALGSTFALCGGGAKSRGRRVALLGCGTGLVVLPALLALAGQGVLGDAYAQAVVFAATRYVENRRLPFFDVAAAAAVLLPIVGGLATVAVRRWRGIVGIRDDAALLEALSGLFIFNYARLRPDPEHLNPAIAFALPLGTYLVAALLASRNLRGRPRVRAAVVLAVIAVLVPIGVGHVRRHVDGFRARAAAKAGAPAPSPARAAGWIGFPTDLAAALSFVEARVPEATPLFVGNERHDRVLINHTLFYFLADRPAVTRYYNLHPGLATTSEVQQEIVRALGAKATPVVVTWRAPLWDEPNATARAGASELDDFLRRRYQPVEHIGDFTLWALEPRGMLSSP
jgi:Dolichyl-phosphate-mannose-protein mannosyltransferase